MGLGYFLMEAMMKTILGRILLRYVSKASGRIRNRGQRMVCNEVAIDEIEASLDSAYGTPAPFTISIKISSRAAIDLEISALSLRIGYSAGGMTIRNFVWSKALSTDPPKNINLHRIKAKRDSHQQLEFVLPPYLYSEKGRRRLYVDGTITFDTIFGGVEFPVAGRVEITSDDVADLTETREFFRERTGKSDMQVERTEES